MTIGQILELTDADIDALSENEQRIVAEVIAAVLDFELHGASAGAGDPRQAPGPAMQVLMPASLHQHKTH